MKSYLLIPFLMQMTLSLAPDQPFLVRNADFQILKSVVETDLSGNMLNAHLAEILQNTYVRVGEPHFPYYDSLVASQFAAFPREYSFADVPLNRLLEPIHNHTYFYYSGNLMLDEFNNLRANINIENLLNSADSLPGLVGTVWISSPEVHATLHYDSVHNLFIQVSGRKKVLLRPPSDTLLSAMYGRNHPHACQSRWQNANELKVFDSRQVYSIKHQRIITESDTETCPPLSLESFLWLHNVTRSELADYELRSVEVMLQPNDILYIPPFWLHETIAVDTSISLSFWWESDVSTTFQDWLSFPLPIEEYWKPSEIQSAIYLYLDYLVVAVVTNLTSSSHHSQTELNGFLRQLLSTRYLEDINCLYPLEAEVVMFEEKLQHYATRLAHQMTSYYLESCTKETTDPNLSFLQSSLRDQAQTVYNHCPSRDIPHNDDHNNLVNTCASSSEDLLIIFLIKVCDYIEDVFTFIAKYLVTSTREEFVGYSKHNPRSLAVALLHHWLQRSNSQGSSLHT